ncbi:hypothetical protein AB1Y20_018980 [Prymnesium parvum]|uniref:Sugar phosphate phosphatase n=1 Tax=Prymnesium parvum TaxID=97485 RepID=A0AB34JPQ9_PRYPA
MISMSLLSTLLEAKPPPLAASDGVHTFTYDSVQRRLPLIVEAVLKNNPSYPVELEESLRNLAAEIECGKPLQALKAPPATWAAEMAPLLAETNTWFTAPWFLVENYFYKRILELTDPVTGGSDPFAAQKLASLAAAEGAFQRMLAAKLDTTEDLERLVMTSLWGNVADLSVSAGDVLVTPEKASEGVDGEEVDDMLLADDTKALCSALIAARSGEVIIVLDNCGLEFVADLLLIDGLLRCGQNKITLHVKDTPVFVSDVTVPDIEPHLSWLESNHGQEMAARLRQAFTDGRVEVEAPTFYTSSIPFYEMPDSLRTRFGAAELVITKGDANYRRMLGDLHWPFDTPFSELMSYWPSSVAALRTCKSGVLVGVSEKVTKVAAGKHPDKWLTGGLYGVVQYHK